MKSTGLSPLPESLKRIFADAPETFTLENGLTVVHQQSAAHPVVSTQVWVKTGSIHEDRFVGSGLSHFLEHMLFKGTERREGKAIAREVQAFGGRINAYTAFDRTVYYIDGPTEALSQSLDLLSDFVFHSTLQAEEVLKERDVILREIDMTLDDPDRILSRSLFSMAYQIHPFRYPVIGLRSLFERVDREILLDYYRARYQPENTVLSVAGDFDPQQLRDLLEDTFAPIQRDCLKPLIIPNEKGQLAIRTSRLYGDYQTARGMLAWKIPSMRDESAPGLDIIASMIGSGHSGRLRQELRETKQLVHDIHASSWNPGNPGLFSIRYHTDTDKAGKAEAAIQELCDRLMESGFTEGELEKARQFACLSEVHSRQTCSRLAGKLGLICSMVGDLQYPRRYFERLFSLTLDDLKSLVSRTFQQDQLSLATLQPECLRPRKTVSPSSDNLPAFEEKRIPNGARLIWQKDPRLPRTWIRFIGLGGCLYEDARIRGATSLMTTLLCRDTKQRNSAQVAAELESCGGFMVENTGNNSFSIGLEITPDKAQFALQTLREAVLSPAFLPETLERERDAQIAYLKQTEDEIFDFGRDAMRRHFFGQHPFSSDPNGTIDSVSQLDREIILSLYKELVVGPNSILVVTGDFDDDLIVHIESFLAELPEADFHRQSLPFHTPAKTGTIVETMDREQAVLFEAYPDVGFVPETEVIGEIFSELLSEMSGPLFTAVREERSLAYFVGASRLLGHEFGTFYLYAGTHPATTDDVFSCFDAEMARIRNGGVTQEELDITRTRLKVEARIGLQSPASRASRVALNALYGKPLMDWLDYEKQLDAITLKDLAAFANTCLSPDKRMRLIVRPGIEN